MCSTVYWCFFIQAEDGIRYLVRSRGVGDVYKRQEYSWLSDAGTQLLQPFGLQFQLYDSHFGLILLYICLLYTSDAADERSSVDLGGRRIIKKKNAREIMIYLMHRENTEVASAAQNHELNK